MEVNRLLDSELTYEMLIRGYPVSGTVDEKRAVLRRLLRQEREGETSTPATTVLDAGDELSICYSKLILRLYTRLLHVTLRLGRINPENEN